jgi:RNA polymerase sigma-B factor
VYGPDAAARAQLVERHLGLARHLALRYRDRGEPLDDLVQVASLGLVKAAERFDPARGVSFSTFAVPTILGELRRHFRDHGWAVRVPRNLQENALRVQRTLALLAAAGDVPTPAAIAGQTGLTIEDVLEALEAAGAHRAVSLDAPLAAQEGDAATLHDVLGADDDELVRASDRTTVARLARVLEERDREILRLRFELDLTQSEIGERVGVSQMQVSRIIRSSLARMRAVARAPDADTNP